MSVHNFVSARVAVWLGLVGWGQGIIKVSMCLGCGLTERHWHAWSHAARLKPFTVLFIGFGITNTEYHQPYLFSTFLRSEDMLLHGKHQATKTHYKWLPMCYQDKLTSTCILTLLPYPEFFAKQTRPSDSALCPIPIWCVLVVVVTSIPEPPQFFFTTKSIITGLERWPVISKRNIYIMNRAIKVIKNTCLCFMLSSTGAVLRDPSGSSLISFQMGLVSLHLQ